jgi:hypothetical protein
LTSSPLGIKEVCKVIILKIMKAETPNKTWLRMVCKHVNFESWVVKISKNCKRSHLWQLRVRLRYKVLFRKGEYTKLSMLHPMFNSKFKTERLKILHRCTM